MVKEGEVQVLPTAAHKCGGAVVLPAAAPPTSTAIVSRKCLHESCIVPEEGVRVLIGSSQFVSTEQQCPHHASHNSKEVKVTTISIQIQEIGGTFFATTSMDVAKSAKS
jgi:hypothetical protein